jgi:hypothetical protein
LLDTSLAKTVVPEATKHSADSAMIARFMNLSSHLCPSANGCDMAAFHERLFIVAAISCVNPTFLWAFPRDAQALAVADLAALR